MEIYPKQINEIRYYKEDNFYANFEYSRLWNSINFSCPEKKINLTFTSQNKEDIEIFWTNLAKKSLDKELEDLNEVLEKMKSEFQTK